MDIGEFYDHNTDRVLRCTPITGIAFWIYQYRQRMAEEVREDEAYLEIMATLGEDSPEYAGDSSLRARRVMWGQASGQILCTVLVCVLYLTGNFSTIAVFLTWGGAILIDAVAGSIMGHLHDRKGSPDNGEN